jgi:hypothetical protein
MHPEESVTITYQIGRLNKSGGFRPDGVLAEIPLWESYKKQMTKNVKQSAESWLIASGIAS